MVWGPWSPPPVRTCAGSPVVESQDSRALHVPRKRGRTVRAARCAAARVSANRAEHPRTERRESSAHRSIHDRVADSDDGTAEYFGTHHEMRHHGLAEHARQLRSDIAAERLVGLARHGHRRAYAILNLVHDRVVFDRDIGNEVLATVRDHRLKKPHEWTR